MYEVLHILTGDDGGISAVVKNYYCYIDRQRIHFDIACTTETEGNDIKALRDMGANIFHLPMKSLGIKAYTRSLKEILKKKTYSVIHVHENQTSYIALKIAKQQGIKCRIAHAHTSSPYISFLSEIRRISGIVLNYHYATNVIGCGELAGNRVFGKNNMKRKKAMILYNAIDLEKFRYNVAKRLDIREKLKISDKFVVGFVGRLSPEKNILFLLNIFKQLHRINEKSHLVIVGTGDEETKIRQYIQENDMVGYVHLMGKRRDVECMYQAFDVLVLPSLHEGFPLVVVEALASGLQVVLSSNITREFSFSENVRYIDLDNKDLWVESLHALSKENLRNTGDGELNQDMFDIRCIVRKLEALYCLR